MSVLTCQNYYTTNETSNEIEELQETFKAYYIASKEDIKELKLKNAYYDGFLDKIIDEDELCEWDTWVTFVEKKSVLDGVRLFGFEGDKNEEEEDESDDEDFVCIECEKDCPPNEYAIGNADGDWCKKCWKEECEGRNEKKK
jgi:hypothetical protein